MATPNGCKIVILAVGLLATIPLWSRSGEDIAQYSGASSRLLGTDFFGGLAFSSDGRRLAAAQKSGSVRIFDVETAKSVQDCLAHRDHVYGLAFTRDGRLLATSAWDQKLALWDARTWHSIAVLPTTPSEIVSLAFAPDCQTLAGGRSSGETGIVLWDVATRRVKGILRGHRWDVTGLAFLASGKELVSVGADAHIRLWNLTTAKVELDWEAHRGRDRQMGIDCVAVAPGGKFFATGGVDADVRLWALDGKELGCLCGHTENVNAIAFSPDGSVLVSVSGASAKRAGEIKAWNVAGRREIASWTHAGAPVKSLAHSPVEARWATISQDGQLELWSALQPQVQRP
jgi:WD40 repeat protein